LLRGKVDEFRMYNRGLDGSEVENIFAFRGGFFLSGFPVIVNLKPYLKHAFAGKKECFPGSAGLYLERGKKSD
jgi:hypothetical protein